MPRDIIIDFEGEALEGELFDDTIAEALYGILPVSVSLTYWGNEAYGSIGHDLGESVPRATIPVGGIAYTRQGNYLCLFFGQDPAWPVEHVGCLIGEGWRTLAASRPGRVTVRVK